MPAAETCCREQLDALRQRFKDRCAETRQQHQNWQIRVHRALSWLERAGETDPVDQPDGRLLYGWIAFNALYGRWDEQAGFAAPDRNAWCDFLSNIIRQDASGLIGQRVVELREPILALLENKFVDPRFWQNPQQPGNLRRQYHEALSMFVERRWVSLATLAIERVYVLRGQLAHGAATRGSELNRRTLQQSREVLEGLLLRFLEVVIEHGCHDNWPPLCYPPIRDEAAAVVPPATGRRPR
jgi:hypothetical protein